MVVSVYLFVKRVHFVSARALLRDPGLILCDEITSSVDAFAEKEIVNTIREACGKHMSQYTYCCYKSSI